MYDGVRDDWRKGIFAEGDMLGVVDSHGNGRRCLVESRGPCEVIPLRTSTHSLFLFKGVYWEYVAQERYYLLPYQISVLLDLRF